MSAIAVDNPTNGHINGTTLNGTSSINGAQSVNGVAQEPVARFATGLILPPPEIKSVIDRTALFVARSANPLQFEDKIREGQRQDPKFSFLNPADPYHGYYRHRMDKIAAGEEDVPADTTEDEKKEVTIDVIEALSKGSIVATETPPPEFILDFPPINAVDLDIIKLTALFTARRGRPFLASLSMKEGRNYEFDFLRPTHSLFGYFNSLLEQYTKILLPSNETLQTLREGTEEGSRWKKLEVAKQHAEWERVKREKEKKKQTDQESERMAFAEIDWHDYAIVQTIEFTTADTNSELPPPWSIAEMESTTLAQKKMATQIMENTVEEVEAHRARQAAAEAEAAAAVGGIGVIGDTEGAMEESDDEDDETKEMKKREEEEREREMERARAIQATSMDAGGPMKIRTDYVPKLGAKNAKIAMTTCTVCGQQVPLDELQEHMRIELLDPRWKSQRDVLEARKAQASELQRGANVDASLRSLARARVDIFGTEADEEKRKKEEQEQLERRKEREKVVWDGHTASKDKTLDKFQTTVNFDEQIAAIHRAKGLGPIDGTAMGPGIGPSVAPASMPSLPPPPPSLPAPPHQASSTSGPTDLTYSAATVSAGPQPASMYSAQPTPVMLPPLHYQGLDAAQPFGYQPPPASANSVGMHPSRLAALGAGSATQPPQTSMVRGADQMDSSGTDDVPPAKRQRVARMSGGQYYPEQDWINLHPHPISLQIQLPNDPSKSEWKLDGSVVTVPDIPVSYTISTLRDHIMRQTGSSVSLSRIILSYNGKMLTNSNSIASYNLEDEDLLVLTLRDVKKKK